MNVTVEQITGRYGARVYKVTDLDTGQIRDLPSVTTVCKVLAAPALERWKMGKVAEGIAAREDLRLLALSGEKEAQDAAWQAEQHAKTTANVGTALHKASETVTTAADAFGAAAEFRAPMERFGKLLDEHGVVIRQTEMVLLNLTVGYSGTADRLVLHDQRRRLADLKTGKAGYFEQAMQLAALANAEYAFIPSHDGHGGGQLVPMPDDVDRDIGLIFHLPASEDRADLLAVPLRDAWEAFRACCVIKHAQPEQPYVAEVLAPTFRFDDGTRTWLRARLEHLQAQHPTVFADLRQRWLTSGLPTLAQQPDLGGEQLEAVCTLLYAVEAHHQVPFPDDYPHPHGPRITADAAKQVRARIDALPAWARADVGEARSKLPSLEEWRIVDLEEFEQILAPAESARDSLQVAVTALLEDAGPAAARVCQLTSALPTDQWSWTEFHVAGSIIEAIGDGYLLPGDDGVEILATVVDRLVDKHGSKSDVTKHLRARVAELGLDIPVPRALAEACQDPLLVALAAA